MLTLILLGVFTLYLIVAITVTWMLVRFVKKRTYKRYPLSIAGITSVMFFVLLPTWDSLIEHLYMRHLCARQAGYEVYQTISLAEEAFTAEGKPKIEYSDVKQSTMLIGEHSYEYQFEEELLINLRVFGDYPTGEGGVFRRIYKIRDHRKQKLLGQFTYFSHISPLSSFSNLLAENCPIREFGDIDRLSKLIFIKNQGRAK